MKQATAATQSTDTATLPLLRSPKLGPTCHFSAQNLRTPSLPFCPTRPREPSDPTISHYEVLNPKLSPEIPNPTCPFLPEPQPTLRLLPLASAFHGYLAPGPHCSVNAFHIANQRQEPPCSTMPQPSVLHTGSWSNQGYFRYILRHSNTMFCSNPSKVLKNEDE